MVEVLKKITNPITKSLYEKGLTLAGYCRINKLSYPMVCLVIAGKAKSKKIEDQLKKDRLWHLIPARDEQRFKGENSNQEKNP